MLPAHYAITEIAIIISSLYSIYILNNRKNYFAIVGISLIAIAAAIGAVRYLSLIHI